MVSDSWKHWLILIKCKYQPTELCLMTSKIIQKMTIMPTLKLGMGEYLPNVKVVDRYTQMSPQSYS